MENNRKFAIKLDTENTTLLFSVDEEGRVGTEYYGRRLFGEGADCSVLFSKRDEDFYRPLAASSFGEYDFRESSLLVEYADGTFSTRLRYAGHRFVQKPDLSPLPSAHGGERTLEITLRDERTGILLLQYYTVYPRRDVITASCEVVNGGRDACFLRRVMSLQLDLPGDRYELTTFNGAWGRERIRSEHGLGCGIFRNESKCGASSAMNNPLVYLRERAGKKRRFAFHLVYSGNHLEEVEITSYKSTRILVGLNDFMLRAPLKPGEKFVAPEAVMVVAESEDELRARLHAFVKKHILEEAWAERERPIVFNNWEATYFDVTEEKVLALADRAVKIGAELFVLDDGWFGKRKDEFSSMGDWYANPEKLQGGLKGLAEKIRGKGLKFGFWVEPEVVSEDSDLFRAHPEFAMKIPGLSPVIRRGELMLDLTNREVGKYLLEALSEAIRSCRADYIKWDFNRLTTDVYTKSGGMNAYFHEYMLGLYELVGALKRRFPEVLFESCASGGGRFDLGLLCFMPQVWTSDNTDARDRVYIQEGTLCGYPQSTMSAHVSICPNHQTGNSTSLESRFNVASCGLLGYELDLTLCSDEELRAMRAQTEFYKAHRRLLQFGEYRRLESAYSSPWTGWMILGQGEAIAVLVLLKDTVNLRGERFYFAGLEEDTMYEATARKQTNVEKVISFRASGSALCGGGLDLGSFFDAETDRTENSNSIASRLFYIRKV